MPRTRSHPAAFPSPPRSPIFLQVYTHGPNYRTLLVANSTVGLGFYPLNAEQDFGEAHTEVAATSPAATSSTVPPLTPHLQPIPTAFLFTAGALQRQRDLLWREEREQLRGAVGA